MKNGNEMKCSIKQGCFDIMVSNDPVYPGVDIEFVAHNSNANVASYPRIVFEYPQDGHLRALIWNDSDSEDYTQEIIFE